jgi:hypothetical protein
MCFFVLAIERVKNKESEKRESDREESDRERARARAGAREEMSESVME